jgi:hypothetical protein
MEGAIMRARILGGCLVALTLAVAPPSAAEDDAVPCERALAKASTKFVGATFKSIQGCLLLKGAGKLPPGACRLLGTTTGHARTDAAVAHAESRLEKGLTACSDRRLAGMAYTAACGDVTPTSTFTRGDLTHCIGRTHRAAVQSLVSIQFPQQTDDCGDGITQDEEDCDPVGAPSGCAEGETCVPGGTPDGCTCIENGSAGACGNGTVDAGEGCDPAAVPTGCAAGLDCRGAGTADQCTCASPTTDECVGECSPACPAGQRCVCECVGPTAMCGNGQKETGEQCDPMANPSGCAPGLVCGAPGTPEQCTCFSSGDQCGNGVLDEGEACDPALPNTCDPGEVCLDSGALACTCGAPPANCGNGRIEWGEQCDPSASPTGCPNDKTCGARGTEAACTCTKGGVGAMCGNGTLDAGEQCDPAASPTGCGAGETCSGQCTCSGGPSQCGNGTLDAGEQCDPAANPPGCPPGVTCSATCTCGPAGATTTSTTPTGGTTTTSTPTGGTTTTTIPVDGCCGEEQIVTVSTPGTLKVSTLPEFPFPSGVLTTMNAGPPDANCRHEVIVPSGGFSVPTFCIPALGFTSDVIVTGCAGGTADGRGVLWDGGAPPSGAGCGDADVSKVGDTTAAPCGSLGSGCTTAPGAAGGDNLGDIDTTRGNGTCDGPGVHTQLDLPGQSITWVDADGGCPDADGVFDEGADTLVTNFSFILSPTTAEATAAFVDKNGDGCAKAGNGPTGPVTLTGSPAPGPCCQVGQQTTVVSVGAAFTGGAPLFDLIFSSSVPAAITQCNPFPGAGTCNIDTQGGCID